MESRDVPVLILPSCDRSRPHKSTEATDDHIALLALPRQRYVFHLTALFATKEGVHDLQHRFELNSASLGASKAS